MKLFRTVRGVLVFDALLIAFIIGFSYLDEGPELFDWVFVGAIVLIACWEAWYYRRWACSCRHQFRDHPDPKTCKHCNCDDYDGRVPPIKAAS